MWRSTFYELKKPRKGERERKEEGNKERNERRESRITLFSRTVYIVTTSKREIHI
jgi:hypothetical protein